ncbi:hypothetical protein ES703_40357 [subsurface metagenome]
MKDTHGRSMVKSIVWRLLGIIVLAIITYLFTRNWITTTLITLFHHLAFILIYYLHERAWLNIRNRKILRWKRWIRPITYELILGHLVLGLISLAFTGSWLQTTMITIVYIENKLWIYILYDWLWEKRYEI